MLAGSDLKGLENENLSAVKYGETFNGRHAVVNTSFSEDCKEYNLNIKEYIFKVQRNVTIKK